MTTKTTIHLGYELGTGNPVAVPLLNLAVTGQTQESGKTTTLEALATRSGAKVITFVTKRGEGSFADGRRIQPYFRDRADWQFVDAILEAALGEKNKFLRQFLIPICRKTKTLAEVHDAIRSGLKKTKGAWKEGAFVQLDAYLELIVPEIARARLASSLDLTAGLNVMDVSEFATPMQMLFVQSALDWVNERERNTVVVIPEAWEFIPEGKGSPVKSSAVTLVRKGSGIGNRIWVDSQDMAGVDKTILRGCPVWLIGVQREINEIKRNIANIPPPTGKPKPGDVAMLERGQFFACFGKTLVKVYVQPAWMEASEAIAIARGTASIETVRERIYSKPIVQLTPGEYSQLDPADQRRVTSFRALLPPAPWPHAEPKEEEVNAAEAAALRERNAELERKVESLLAEIAALRGPAERAPAREQDNHPGVGTPAPMKAVMGSPPSHNIDELDIFYKEIKRRILADPAVIAAVAQTRPEIEVNVTRQVIQIDHDKQPGFLAGLIATKYFDKPIPAADVVSELKRRGRSVHHTNVYRDLNRLAEQGFLTVEDGGYQAVPGMKVNIVEA